MSFRVAARLIACCLILLTAISLTCIARLPPSQASDLERHWTPSPLVVPAGPPA